MRWKALESIKRRVSSKRSDVWSFGVVLYEIFSLAMVPYHDIADDREVARSVMAGERLPQPVACSDAVYAIMQACWQSAPKNRPNMTIVHARLQEAFAQELHAAKGVICLDAKMVRLPARNTSEVLFSGANELQSAGRQESSEVADPIDVEV